MTTHIISDMIFFVLFFQRLVK